MLWEMLWIPVLQNVDGLIQDCSNSSAVAMELMQSCTKPLINTCETVMSCCKIWFVLNVLLKFLMKLLECDFLFIVICFSLVFHIFVLNAFFSPQSTTFATEYGCKIKMDYLGLAQLCLQFTTECMKKLLRHPSRGCLMHHTDKIRTTWHICFITGAACLSFSQDK